MHNFIFVGCDTDGLAFKKPDESVFTKQEADDLLSELNSKLDEFIRFANEGMVKKQINIKAKNYILFDPENPKPKKRLIVKGAGLKATTKEKALQRFVGEIINLLLTDKQDQILELYFKYARETIGLTDISQWCSKHTVTKAVLTGKGTAQVRLREALKGKSVQEGDKFYVFFKTDEERCLLENFDGTYDHNILLGKLYDTLCVFETVIDIKQFPNLTLKRNQELLKGLL